MGIHYSFDLCNLCYIISTYWVECVNIHINVWTYVLQSTDMAEIFNLSYSDKWYINIHMAEGHEWMSGF